MSTPNQFGTKWHLQTEYYSIKVGPLNRNILLKLLFRNYFWKYWMLLIRKLSRNVRHWSRKSIDYDLITRFFNNLNLDINQRSFKICHRRVRNFCKVCDCFHKKILLKEISSRSYKRFKTFRLNLFKKLWTGFHWAYNWWKD